MTGSAVRSGFRYGGCDDIPAPGDYDADGVNDLALYRQDCVNGSTWNAYSIAGNRHLIANHRWGGCGDIPATA
ncbi:hypothetical protein AB0J82_22670 [Asanoa sp. NPDC049518]|uniref:hypothetical protein n=1 Tax=unclassified Asanoa TaxID=2685164 RepID=UPI003424518D